MFRRIIKFIVAIIILPVAAAVSVAFFRQLGDIYLVAYPVSQFFLWGLITYVGIHLFLFKPQYLYTLGHEMMHAVAAWACGGRVTTFRVSKEEGAVKTTKDNFFISLSPYLFPFYTLLVSLAYFLGSLLYDLSYLSSYFIFLVGFTLAMHVICTVEVLRQEQPDILRTGYLFSAVLIYIVNVTLIAVIVSLLFKDELSVGSFFHRSYIISRDIYIKAFKQLFWL